MKISCNVIEDLLPLYVDEAASEDSRQLVEEHLKGCSSCRKMLEEIKKDNQLGTDHRISPEENKKAEIQSLKNIRKRILRKRILSVILAAVLVFAVCETGHYWMYDKETYLSWEDTDMTVKDNKLYGNVNPLGRIRSVISVDQKNMFYMVSETGWTRKEYPTEENKTYEILDFQDFEEAYNRGPEEPADETSMPAGIENVYYVEPADIKEAESLWDYADQPDKALEKEEELASRSILIWSAGQNNTK